MIPLLIMSEPVINTTQLNTNLPNDNSPTENVSGSTTPFTLPVLLLPLPNETEKLADQALSGRETATASSCESPKANEGAAEKLSSLFQKMSLKEETLLMACW